MQDFTKMMAHPETAVDLRFSDEYSSEPTSTATLHNYVPINNSLGTRGSYPGLGGIPNSGCFELFLFRDVLRSMVVYTPNPGALGYMYTATFFNPSSQTNQTTQSITASANDCVAIDFTYFTDSRVGPGFFHPHGTGNFYPGMSGGLKGIWLDGNAFFTATVTFTQSIANVTARVNVLLFNGENFDDYSVTAAFASGTTTFAPTIPGYYAFKYIDSVASAAQLIGVVISGSGDCFGHLALPSVDTNLANLTKARVLASSVKLSDAASPLNREGQVYIAQFPLSNAWWAHTNVLDVTACRNAYAGLLEKGVYGFMKPASSDDFLYNPYICTQNGTISSACFNLNAQSEYLQIIATTVAVGAVYPGYDFIISQFSAIEFITPSQFFQAELPMYTTLQVMQSMETLKHVPQFSENPTHLIRINAAVTTNTRRPSRRAPRTPRPAPVRTARKPVVVAVVPLRRGQRRPSVAVPPVVVVPRRIVAAMPRRTRRARSRSQQRQQSRS
jgi:hypothetical protein